MSRKPEVSPTLSIVPLTPERWPALEDLFGERGACSGCWCMYWRIGAAYRKRPSEENRAAFHVVVSEGPPPGLLAFADDLAVGWCQVTPRAVLPWIDKTWRLRRLDEMPVWSISCFYVRKGWRRKGVTRALLAGAIEMARVSGAPAIEAYPLDGALSPSSTSTGYASSFVRVGFREVARWSPEKPILRFDLGSDAVRSKKRAH